MKVCAEKDCATLTTEVRCPAHTRPKTDNRPSASERGYDHKWALNSARFLLEHPNCIECGMPATVADHDPMTRRELVAAGDPHPDAWHHLRPRCKACHARKSGRGR